MAQISEELLNIAKQAIKDTEPIPKKMKADAPSSAAGNSGAKRKSTTTRLQEQLPPAIYNVSTQNKYSVLEGNEDMDISEPQQAKEQKPPPIIIRKRPVSPTEFEKIIIDVIGKDKFFIKWCLDRLTIYCKGKADRVKLLQHFKDADTDYHSFTPKDERKHAKIIYNLYTDLNENELLEEIKLKLDADSVVKLKNTKAPIYMVLLNKNYAVTELNKDHKFIGHTRIKWANFKNKKDLTQCKRCQDWGHATTNCNARYVCLKCGENHPTYQCKMPKEMPAKFGNCQQSHPANSKECTVYKKALAKSRYHKQKGNPASTSRPKELQLENDNYNQVNYGHRPNDFPSLPACNMTTSAIPLPTPNGNLGNVLPVPPTNDKSNFDNFNELMAEISKLHQMINIDKMLQLVKELNKRLVGTKTTAEKFNVFISFTNTING